jgi:hypothetical protein
MRVEEESSSEIEIKKLLEIFEFETKEAGLSLNNQKRLFYEHIPKVYPNVIKERRKTAHETKTFYRGIRIRLPHIDQHTKFSELSELKQYLYKEFIVIEEKNQSVTCKTLTGTTVNDTPVCKTVQFLQDGTWVLSVSGKVIDLNSLYVSNKFLYTKESIQLVCEIISKLKLCVGVKARKAIITRFHSVERVTDDSRSQQRIVRSILCDRLVNMNTVNQVCRKCQKMTLQEIDSNKENNSPGPENTEVSHKPQEIKTNKKKFDGRP